MDQIDAAIAKAEEAPRFSGQMALSTGRVVAINLPIDLSDAEFIEAIVILAVQVRTSARKAQVGALSRIIVPVGVRVS